MFRLCSLRRKWRDSIFSREKNIHPGAETLRLGDKAQHGPADEPGYGQGQQDEHGYGGRGYIFFGLFREFGPLVTGHGLLLC